MPVTLQILIWFSNITMQTILQILQERRTVYRGHDPGRRAHGRDGCARAGAVAGHPVDARAAAAQGPRVQHPRVHQQLHQYQ